MLTAEHVLNGRYRIVRLIGQGGLSYVYEAEDVQLPRRWAIKELRPPAALSAAELQAIRIQFQGEVAMLSRLSHPRLPLVADAFEADGRDYMVMELIQGQTLDALLHARETPFEEAQVIAWTLQMVDILTYLHAQSPPIVYRDIKPQNIMIDEAVGLRFIDFGIARLFNPVKEQDTIFMGTPGFAPPEQFRQKQTDPRSDIYSLGATLHYLLTLQDPGDHPFTFAPITNQDVSGLLQQVVQKCVEIRPENRFQNAADIARVLRGEIALQDVAHAPVLVVEPRELSLENVSPSRHTRSVTVHAVGGRSAAGRWQGEHAGLHIEPDHFDDLPASFQVAIDGRRFPRGETVSTSLVLSTGAAKIKLPIQVQVRPVWLRGLSPGVGSLLLFMVPVVAAVAWWQGSWSIALPVAVAATAILAAMAVPSQTWDWITASCWMALAAVLGALLDPLSHLDKLDPKPDPQALPQLFLAVALSLLSNGLLLRLTLSFSVRQRQEMNPVPRVAFFLYPALLYAILPLSSNTAALIATHQATFVGLLLALSVPWLLVSLQAQRPLVPHARSLAQSLVGVLAAAALAAALWLPFQTLQSQVRFMVAAGLPSPDSDPHTYMSRIAQDSDHMLLDATQESYLLELYRGLQAAQRGLDDSQAYFHALGLVPESEPLHAQLVYMFRQSLLRSLQPGMFEPLQVTPGTFSDCSIQWFSGPHPWDRPAPLFYYEDGEGPHPFHSDIEIWAAMQYQILMTMDPGEHDEHVPEIERQMQVVEKAVSSGRGPILASIAREVGAFRRWRRHPAEWMRWYLDEHDDLMAWRMRGISYTLDDALRLYVGLFPRLQGPHPPLTTEAVGRCLRPGDPAMHLAQLYLTGHLPEALTAVDRLPPSDSPTLLRIERNVMIDTRHWEAAARYGARLLGPQDDLAEALALDMQGRSSDALPLYRRYLAHPPPGEDAGRLRLVRLRTNGAPLASLVQAHQMNLVEGRWCIVGQGIPEDLLPELVLTFPDQHTADAGPTTSGTIRLELKDKRDQGALHSRYYQVHFLKENGPRGPWRFWVTAPATRAFTSTMTQRRPALLNSLLLLIGSPGKLTPGWFSLSDGAGTSTAALTPSTWTADGVPGTLSHGPLLSPRDLAQRYFPSTSGTHVLTPK